MSTFYEFRQKISKLVKDKQYPEALKCFKEEGKTFSKQEVAANEYLVSDILTSLRKTNEFDKALLFLKYLGINIDTQTSQRTLSAYGWVLYSKLKAESLLNDQVIQGGDDDFFDGDEEYSQLEDTYEVNKSELITLIENILPLVDHKNDFGYTLYSFLFLTVLKAEKKKPSTNWRFVNEFCDLVNPDDLHTDCRTIKVVRKGQEKDMELASDREYWYAYKSKALDKIKEFQQCYDISKKALEAFDKFHYSNDIWFTRRIALAKKHIGNPNEAINELLGVLRKKKEWFIQKEIADLYYEKGDFKSAFQYATQAILNFGDLEYKVDLLYLIGLILRAQGESELAYKHYSLSKLIRIKESWSVPQKLYDAISVLQLPPFPESDFESLKKELKEYWQSLNPERQENQKFQKRRDFTKPNTSNNSGEKSKGKIEKILHNDAKGMDGFIRTTDNKGVYFRLSPEMEITKKISVGVQVECSILPAKDGKKERAVNIKVITA